MTLSLSGYPCFMANSPPTFIGDITTQQKARLRNQCLCVVHIIDLPQPRTQLPLDSLYIIAGIYPVVNSADITKVLRRGAWGAWGIKSTKCIYFCFLGWAIFFFRFVDIVLIKIKDGISVVFLILHKSLILLALSWWS